MATRNVYNATTQQIEEATLTVDDNNEIVATFENGHFAKFPAGLTQQQFDEAVVALDNEDNHQQEIITPEMEAEKEAERNNSLTLIGEGVKEEKADEDSEDKTE